MSESLDIRRKRLRFRSWRRGTKELDLLLGPFADARLDALDAAQLDRYEALLEMPEPLIYAWITGQGDPPPEADHDVMCLLRDFTARP
ncbi:MAG: succinate dehydrogenase assembly factor 2 [Kiloniellales bacterium]